MSRKIEKGVRLWRKDISDRGGVGRTTYLLRPNGTRHVAVGLDINRSAVRTPVIGEK